MTRVKICGLRTVEQALVAAEAGADFIGLMFAESRRKVAPADAADIVRALGTPLAEREMADPPSLFRTDALDHRSWFEHGASALERLLERKRPITVGVFANNAPDEINEIVDECGIDLIQLSGGEPWEHVLLANRQVIKVVHVSPNDDVAAVSGRVETGSAMAVMLDSGGGGAFGGTGTKLDWSVAASVAAAMPVWLAGGLNAANVATAIAQVQPWCVDVSSGVETDGVKDLQKIRDFIHAVKSA